MIYLKEGHLLNGRYRVKMVAGRGGQGAVYKVTDTHVFDKVRAAKEILANVSSDIEALLLFKKEAVFLSTLDNPGLPKITDFFKEQGKYYIIMEYIDGKNLEEIMKTYPEFFNEKRVIEIALKLCDILHYTHNLKPQPLIFRDIKPANIIFNRDKIVLIDFGTARFFDKRKSEDTFHFGTIGYAPPEQYSGLTDARSDIYAFGVTLFYLLTGVDPSGGNTLPAKGVSVKKYRSELSADIDHIIRKMTVSNPNDRYPSIAEVKDNLLKCSSIVQCPQCGKIHLSSKTACTACGSRLERYSAYLNDTYILAGIKGDNRVYEFTKPMLTIGRNHGNDLIIHSPDVSRNHAVIHHDENGFYLSDLGSKAGTFIKTGKIHKRITKNLIKPGWKICFGNGTEYEFKMKDKVKK